MIHITFFIHLITFYANFNEFCNIHIKYKFETYGKLNWGIRYREYSVLGVRGLVSISVN